MIGMNINTEFPEIQYSITQKESDNPIIFRFKLLEEELNDKMTQSVIQVIIEPFMNTTDWETKRKINIIDKISSWVKKIKISLKKRESRI